MMNQCASRFDANENPATVATTTRNATAAELTPLADDGANAYGAAIGAAFCFKDSVLIGRLRRGLSRRAALCYRALA